MDIDIIKAIYAAGGTDANRLITILFTEYRSRYEESVKLCAELKKSENNRYAEAEDWVDYTLSGTTRTRIMADRVNVLGKECEALLEMGEKIKNQNNFYGTVNVRGDIVAGDKITYVTNPAPVVPQAETTDVEPPKVETEEITAENAIDFLKTQKELIDPKCPKEKGSYLLDEWDGVTYLPRRKGKKQKICRELYEKFPDWDFCKEFIEKHLPSISADFDTFKSKSLKILKAS